jgi:hypothetical protein
MRFHVLQQRGEGEGAEIERERERERKARVGGITGYISI